MTRPAAPHSERTGLMRMGAAAMVLAACAAVTVMVLDGGAVAAGLAVMLSLAGVTVGYGVGRRNGSMPPAIRMQMFRVADELAQYRAFTRLLRDQGERITASTSEAATAIVIGLREMDSNIVRMRAIVERDASADAHELQSVTDAIGAPLLGLLGQLQFQDVTQQQIAFLSRLSLIVDQHMMDLARQLGDRRSMDRVGNFKEMFDKALDDCVMTSQREDHHIAAGLNLQEAGGPKIELF